MGERMQMTDRDIIELIATKVMLWTLPEWSKNATYDKPRPCVDTNGVIVYFDPLSNADHSKQLRAKLAEIWDWNLGHAEAFAFALWPKGTPPKWTTKPTHVAIGDTEERAVVGCVLKMLEVE